MEQYFPRRRSVLERVTFAHTAKVLKALGYRHIGVFDHVVGADPGDAPGVGGPYDVDTEFHEPFVLFGFLAAVTSLELVTEIVILPQRQTALVAKQAAEVDLLTEGRFRLGVGIGWNAVEYEALGEDFTARVGDSRNKWSCCASSGRSAQSPSRESSITSLVRELRRYPRAAPHPDLDGRWIGENSQSNGTVGRRLVPGVPTGSGAELGDRGNRRSGH